MPRPVAVMSAIPGELSLFRERIGVTGLVLVESGIGKVNAAVTATRLVDQHGPSTIVFTGVAGALDPDLGVGDVVIGERTVQHDAGVRTDARLEPYQAGHIPFFNPTERLGYEPSESLLDLARESARTARLTPVLGRDPRVMEGTIVSGDQFISSAVERDRLHRDFGALAVEMEGAAVAQVADRLGVDCIVIRAVSDLAGEDSHLDFARFTAEVAANAAAVVEQILSGLQA